jgi:Ca2+-binding EF-hand superfamily protein
MRGNGRLTRKQLKGILSTHQSQLISDSDIDAIMRRMDSDGDDEISFSDFFSNLLPYLIYGESRPTTSKNEHRVQKVSSENRSLLNIKVRSASNRHSKAPF